jgi:hypothetical protein
MLVNASRRRRGGGWDEGGRTFIIAILPHLPNLAPNFCHKYPVLGKGKRPPVPQDSLIYTNLGAVQLSKGAT